MFHYAFNASAYTPSISHNSLFNRIYVFNVFTAYIEHHSFTDTADNFLKELHAVSIPVFKTTRPSGEVAHATESVCVLSE
jgi:hypothetical protein